MNFYKHHLGDYDGHTAHLTWDEDMAYTRLLRAYYRRESPIPDAEKYRFARAASKAQRAAVDSVLAEFFAMDGDMWRQKRCDEEVAAYQAQSDTNRRIARERTVQRTVDEPSTKGTPNQNQIPEPEKEKASLAPKNGARHAIPDDSPIIQTLPLRDGTEFEVRQSFVAELEPLYPSVDVTRTVGEMKGWLLGNKERRKTRSGVKAFITRWLHSEQEKAEAH